MQIDKSQLWPKTGKAKKALIILAIVIVASLAAVLIEEKTNIKLSNRFAFVIALLSIGVWVYQKNEPVKKD